jgi:putative ABC transport system permease protein
VTWEALQLVIVGLAAGAILSMVLTRTIRTLLVAVTAHDPVTFVVVPLVVILVALAATLLPAWRAMAIEPTHALRAQ